MRPSAFGVFRNRKMATGLDLPPVPGIFDGSGGRILPDICPAHLADEQGFSMPQRKSPPQMGQQSAKGRSKGNALALKSILPWGDYAASCSVPKATVFSNVP